MSSIPDISNIPQLSEDSLGMELNNSQAPQGKSVANVPEALTKELNKEAEKRAEDALAALEQTGQGASSTDGRKKLGAGDHSRRAQLLAEVEANPENVVFFAMIDQSTTVGQSISAYYQAVENQNKQIAYLNSVLTQLDNLEATAEGNGGPNGTAIIPPGLQAELNKLGIATPEASGASAPEGKKDKDKDKHLKDNHVTTTTVDHVTTTTVPPDGSSAPESPGPMGKKRPIHHVTTITVYPDMNMQTGVNSTQLGEMAQSVNNDISTLSTQSSTTMDQLQMLSNDYNTDVQQLSSFLQSIAQTQQGTAHNM